MGFLTRLGEGIASAARVVGNAVKEVTYTVKEFVGDAWNAITFRLDVGYDHPEIIDMQMEQQSCEIVKEVLGGEPFDQFAVLLPAERKMAIENVIAETSDMMGVELEGIAFADLGDVSGFYSEKGKVIALNEEPLCQEVMTEEEARELARSGAHVMEDAGRGYRKVVASPKPVDIVEIQAIRNLVDSGNVVIACGGGGVPVVKKGNRLEKVDSVIDKDFASARLAQLLDADFLVLLTVVEKVAINYAKPDQKWLSRITVEEAREYIRQGQFAPGSMLPKIEAAVEFAVSKAGRKTLITMLEQASVGIQGGTGTMVVA